MRWLVPQRPGRLFRDVRFDAGKTYVFPALRSSGDTIADMQLESAPATGGAALSLVAPRGRDRRCSVNRYRARRSSESLPASSSDRCRRTDGVVGQCGIPRRAPARSRPAAARFVGLSRVVVSRAIVHAADGANRSCRVSPSPARAAPVRPAFPDNDPIALPPPRLEQWMAEDPPLARVIEDRRSAAAPGSNRLTLTRGERLLLSHGAPAKRMRTARCQAPARDTSWSSTSRARRRRADARLLSLPRSVASAPQAERADDPVAELLARAARPGRPASTFRTR